MNELIPIIIDPVTDVFIGSSNKLTTLDYVLDDSLIKIYSFQELLNDIDVTPEMVTDVINFINDSRNNNRYEINFKLLAEKLGVTNIDKYLKHIFKYAVSKNNLNVRAHSELEIFPQNYDNGKSFFYIPGSSLKGAFRTAVENYFLQQELTNTFDLNSKEFVEDLKQKVDSFFKPGTHPLILFNDVPLRNDDYFVVKRVHRFMKRNNKYSLSNLSLVQFLNRVHQYGGDIVANKLFLKSLFKITNNFTKQVIETKLDVSKKIQDIIMTSKKYYIPKANPELTKYILNLTNLKKKLDNVSEDECYLFIGKYKGFFETSYGSTIINKFDFEEFKRLKQKLGLGKKNSFGRIFPSTLTMTENHEPVGLVKISIDTENDE